MRSTILVNTGPTTVTMTWYVNGTPTNVGDVTIGITDGNGAAVVASGTATTNALLGKYTYPLPKQARVGVLYLSWTDVSSNEVLTDEIEVVGSYLFSISEARSYAITGGVAALSSTSTYPTDTLAEWRNRISDMFEQRTLRSFVKRYCRVELAGTGSSLLYLSDGMAVTADGDAVGGPGRSRDFRKVLSVTVNGTAVSLSDVKLVNNGILRRLNGTWPVSTSDPYNVVVEYEYGRENTEAKENGLRMLLSSAVPSDVSSRATSFSSEDGTFRLTTFPVQVEEFIRTYDARTFV